MEGFYRLGSTLDEGHGFSRAINAALMRALAPEVRLLPAAQKRTSAAKAVS
jgi:hypothetical protein